MDPNSTVRIVTDLMLRENTGEKLFEDERNFKTITVEKNIRQTLNILNSVMLILTFSLRQLFAELEEECEIISSQVDLYFLHLAQNMIKINRSRRLVTSHQPQSGFSRSWQDVVLRDCQMILIRSC